MGLKTMSLLTGATIAASDGSALVFAEDGITIPNGIHLMVPADDYQERRVCTIKYRPPTVNVATGAYSKDKKSISYSLPLVLADGSIVFNTFRVEREVHPTLPAADALDLIVVGAQMLFDADCVGFWATGSLT